MIGSEHLSVASLPAHRYPTDLLSLIYGNVTHHFTPTACSKSPARPTCATAGDTEIVACKFAIRLECFVKCVNSKFDPYMPKSWSVRRTCKVAEIGLIK
jgi:hypothetical protein